MEWLATSPRMLPGAAALFFCNGTSLANRTEGASLCQCKLQQRLAAPTACYQLFNLTSQPGPTPACGSGCPAGYSVYATGSSLACLDPVFGTDPFTLFETACQSTAGSCLWIILF